MHKLWASTYKEFLLLTRDVGGLAVLFLMPLLLVITITTIQDNTFKSIQAAKIPILLVDNDKGEVSQNINENLNISNLFEVVQNNNEVQVKELVHKGEYKMAIVIPENLSKDLNKKIEENVEGILAKFGLEEENIPMVKTKIQPKEVRLYFDPATQQSFKGSVRSSINQMIAKIESKTIYKAFQEQLTDDESEVIFDTAQFISFKEIDPNDGRKPLSPNSTQHNIPAWTLFAIFFIMLPLGINMVKEKNQGTFVRLRTNPVSYATVLGGKTLVFLSVALVQFALMLLVGVYLFPAIGLPQLEVTGRLPLLFTVAFFAGLAAVGLGLLLGTLAKTQEQSAPWIPVFAMPKLMQSLSQLSPMNWGLSAFYDVFLRDVGFVEILPEISLLSLFFIATISVAIMYNKRKNAV